MYFTLIYINYDKIVKCVVSVECPLEQIILDKSSLDLKCNEVDSVEIIDSRHINIIANIHILLKIRRLC